MRAALSAIDQLSTLLAPAVRAGALAMAPPDDAGLASLIQTLHGRVRGHAARLLPADQQRDALQRFWHTRQLTSLKDARLVTYGLGLAASDEGARLIDDPVRLEVLLDALDRWREDTRRFGRIYQGLLWSYFNLDFDHGAAATGDAGLRLRVYLAQRARHIADRCVASSPDWMRTLSAHPHLLGDAPWRPHVASLQRGERAELDALCAAFGIAGASWFMRGLLQALLDVAIGLPEIEFHAALPALLAGLEAAPTLRDTGLARLLTHAAVFPSGSAPADLCTAAARWWGLPWRPENSPHWQRLSDPVRERFADALKASHLAGFFTNPRGAAFWSRYTQAMRHLEISVDGATLTLTLGRASIVESADLCRPLQGFDQRSASDGAPPDLEVPHQDGLHGWRRWEEMAEDALRARFDLRPGATPPPSAGGFIDLSDPVAPAAASTPTSHWKSAPAGEDAHWQTAEAAVVPYSRPDLEVLARVHALRLDDETARTGRLWVRADAADARIARVLTRWGFQHVAGEGWCK